MTWKELKNQIGQMTKEQQKTDVTIHIDSDDEWFPVYSVEITTVADVLDDNHPYLEVKQ